MKKILKFIKYFICGILLLLIILTIFTIINNSYQLRKESKILNPTGTLVDVSGEKIHVYTEGSGKETCVFLSGLGNVAPEIEMKPLYKLLSSQYKIAVVDRTGYGFSSSSNDDIDIDTIIEDTRESLKKSNIEGPYILFAHSISGLYATYYAQKYPDEVKAIVGLDMDYPIDYVNAFNDYDESKNIKSSLKSIKIQSFLVKLGFHRLFPSVTFDEKILNNPNLTNEDINLYKALTNKNLSNKDIINEFASLEENARKSVDLPLPKNTPILIFLATPLSSDEFEKKSDYYNERINRYTDYLSNFENSKLICSPGKHSIYLYCPEDISSKSIEFINSLEV